MARLLLSSNPDRTRVLLGELPPLLCDILIDAIAAQPDLEVVVRGSADSVGAALESGAIDVTILCDCPSTPQIAGAPPRPVTRCARQLVVVSYTDRDGGTFSFRRLRVCGLSQAALVEAIRAARAGRSDDTLAPAMLVPRATSWCAATIDPEHRTRA